jgi:hypothetical protein
MDGKKNQPNGKQDRNLASLVRKLGDEEINMFLAVLDALMRQVPAPRDARKSYLEEVNKRLRNNGIDFLSKSRSFPTYGLKLLGNDRTGFPIPGFKRKKDKIYPKLFAWYWGELERLSLVYRPTKADVKRAQRVLCVLSFSKMIKTSSVTAIRKSLESFEERTSPTGSSLDLTEMLDNYENNLAKSISDTTKMYVPNIPPELLALAGYDLEPTEDESPDGYYDQPDIPGLIETLGVDIKLGKYPKYTDFSSLSQKPCALKDRPGLPEWFDNGGPADFGHKKPPYGKIHVLTESAGKLRIICPYNTPFVHSTGLYTRARSVLNRLRQDYSMNQTAGHRFVQQRTNPGYKGWCVSADLSNFSDDISVDLATFGLRSLGLERLKGYLFNLPVTLPNGRFLIPDKLLMGLKGCFELSSLCHHYVVQAGGIKSYAMVGDDLFFRGDFDSYLKAIEHSGWSINRNKTVISKTVAVFCGEMYWLGHRISPTVPKVSSCFHNGKPYKASILFSVTRSAIANLNDVFNRRSVAQVIAPFLHLLRKRWRAVIPLYTPQKLRGMGLKPWRPGYNLLRTLKRRDVLRASKLSIGIKKEEVSSTRWFGLPIELAPDKVQPEFSFIPALLKRGAVRLDVPKNRPAVRKNVSSLDLSDVLWWYYENTRLEIDHFR